MFLPLPVSAGETGSGEAANHIALNQLLQDQLESPAAEILAELETFVEQHSEFVRGYHTLLDFYLVNDQAERASSFFGQQSVLPEARRNSQWMLAKLRRIQKRPDDAYGFFVEAIQSGPQNSLPIELIWRFADLDVGRAGGDASRSLIESTVSDSSLLEVVEGIYLYENRQFGRFIDLLDPIPTAFATDRIILRLLGYCHAVRAEYGTSAKYWSEAAAQARAIHDTRSTVRFQSFLGYLKERQGDYEGAIVICERAAPLAKSIGDRQQLAYIEGLLGYFQHEIGQYAKADSHFTSAISNITKLNQSWEVIDLYRGLAYSRYRQGKYQDALDLLSKCEGLLARENLGETFCLVQYEKAEILASLEQLDLAEQSLLRAIEMAGNSGLIYREKEAKAALGDIAKERGDFGEARRLYREFIAYLKSQGLTKKLYGWQAKIAECYLDERNYERARVETLKALRFARSAKTLASEGHSLNVLAEIEFSRAEVDSALKHSQRALGIGKQLGNSKLVMNANVTFGDIHQYGGKLQEAILFYSATTKIVERTRAELEVAQLRRGFFSQGHEAYRGLVDCYANVYLQDRQPAHIDSLLYYYQRGRSRVLNDARNSSRADQSDDYLQACEDLRVVQRRIRSLKQQYRPESELANLYTALEAARFTVEAQRLRATGDSTVAMPEAAALKQVQAYTEHADLGYLLYHISGDRSFVLFAHKSRFELVPLDINPDSLARDIRMLLLPLHNVEAGKVSDVIFRADLAHSLYRKLLAPVVSLDLPDNLLIVPDFSLMQLPFEMLLSAPASQHEYTPLDPPGYKDSFFGAEHAVAYGAGVFVDTMPGRTPWNAGVLAFSNGASPGQDLMTSKGAVRFDVSWRFDALEYAKSEVIDIQSVHGNTVVLDRGKATKENLRQHGPDSDVLHFATHAFSDSVFAGFAGLVLSASDDTTDDGVLMGYEVQDYDLNCELVTLSACETGRGQVQIGEGLLGLPRQFLAAGSKSVLMSLWKVDDRFASRMMPIFYRHYLAEGKSKIGALWHARKEVISAAPAENGHNYQHPFYWAAFTLYGDPGVARRPILIPVLAVVLVCLLLLSAVVLRRRKTV